MGLETREQLTESERLSAYREKQKESRRLLLAGDSAAELIDAGRQVGLGPLSYQSYMELINAIVEAEYPPLNSRPTEPKVVRPA